MFLANVKQPLACFSFTSFLYLTLAGLAFVLSEAVPVFVEQGAVFLLVFYKIPTLATIALLANKVHPFVVAQLFTVCLVFAPVWNNLLYLHDNLSAPIHSYTLVLVAVLLASLAGVGSNISKHLNYLSFLLFNFILIGGLWVYYNNSLSSLWSWDPVEVASLGLLAPILVYTHKWASFQNPFYFAVGVALVKFFRLGPALSSHHLVNASTTYELPYKLELDFISYPLPNPCNVFVACAASLVLAWSLTLVFTTFRPKALFVNTSINFYTTAALFVTIVWLLLLYNALLPLYLIALIFLFFFKKTKVTEVIIKPHLVPLSAVLILFYGALLSVFAESAALPLAWVAAF